MQWIDRRATGPAIRHSQQIPGLLQIDPEASFLVGASGARAPQCSGASHKKRSPQSKFATAANNPENVNSQSSKCRSAAPDSNASKRQRTEIIVDDSNTDTVSESDLKLELLPPRSFNLPLNLQLPAVTQTTQPDPLSPAPQYLSTGSLSLGGLNHSDHNPRPSVRTYLGTRSYTSANVQALRYPPHDSNTSTATSATLTAPTRSAPRPPPAPSPQAGPPALPAQPISRPQASSRAQPSSRAPTIPGSLSAPHPRQPGSGPPPNANPPLRQPSTAQPRSSVHPQHPSQHPSQRPSSQRPSSQRPSSQRPSSQRPSSQCSSLQRPLIQRSACGVQDARSRPRDPVALAKMDMVEFNHAQREEQDRSLADSATRHLRYVEAERARLSPDPSYRLVEDDEQIRECAKAIVSGVPMPRSSDSTGLSGQVLCLAKLGLFGLACSQGPYQTRGRLLHWAHLVHEETWNHEAPDIPYVAATKGELAVMVNNLATLRGRVKDRMRPVIQEGYGFRPFAVSQEDIQYNRELYARLTPNNFHCTSFLVNKSTQQFTPRAGHYENGEIFHAVAAAFFHGPNSIAVLFPEYFDDMALEVIAFVLAMMQFCIEEWINGWFEPKDLSAGNMLDKYESHLFGLKEAAAIAPERMEFLQDYSRASTSRQNGGQECIHRSEIRPDTPPPAPPVEEDDMLVEYNEEGRLTARAKGKRRGN
ncbi:hypothetical protein BDV93DRAFT_512069 [Ceratobasidium sp. AG-I]|nr:hypothetical protein BDV93DRAFT_512069 [Ceratobasidium sp. AG-I]